MNYTKNYTSTSRMSDLVSKYYQTLPLLSRFGIPLGFGDKTIDTICKENDIETGTFLSVIQLLIAPDEFKMEKINAISITSLMSYLQSSHSYFLDYRLPKIREALANAIDKTQTELNEVVLKYFDDYITEVKNHMDYEDKVVFPYVKKLLKGEKSQGYHIGVFTKQHDQVETRLTEFKELIIRYYPTKGTNEVLSVLFDIFNCEADLYSHHLLEERLFTPAIKEIENSVNKPNE